MWQDSYPMHFVHCVCISAFVGLTMFSDLMLYSVYMYCTYMYMSPSSVVYMYMYVCTTRILFSGLRWAVLHYEWRNIYKNHVTCTCESASCTSLLTHLTPWSPQVPKHPCLPCPFWYPDPVTPLSHLSGLPCLLQFPSLPCLLYLPSLPSSTFVFLLRCDECAHSYM